VNTAGSLKLQELSKKGVVIVKKGLIRMLSAGLIACICVLPLVLMDVQAADEAVFTHKWSFERETHGGASYIGKVTGGTAEISDEQADQGEKSLKVIGNSGNVAQIDYSFVWSLRPKAGEWVNLKVFVPDESTVESIQLVYKYDDGENQYKPVYTTIAYFNPPILRNQWRTLSCKVPEDISVTGLSLMAKPIADSPETDPFVFYVDSYYTSTKQFRPEEIIHEFGPGFPLDDCYRMTAVSDTTENTTTGLELNPEPVGGADTVVKVTGYDATQFRFESRSRRFLPQEGQSFTFRVYFDSSSVRMNNLRVFYAVGSTYTRSTAVNVQQSPENYDKWHEITMEIPAGTGAVTSVGIEFNRAGSPGTGATPNVIAYVDYYMVFPSDDEGLYMEQPEYQPIPDTVTTTEPTTTSSESGTTTDSEETSGSTTIPTTRPESKALLEDYNSKTRVFLPEQVTVNGKKISAYDLELKIETFGEKHDRFNAVKAALSGKASGFTIYDIRLILNGVDVWPEETVVISIFVPAEYALEKSKLLFVNQKGNVLPLESSLNGDDLVFNAEGPGSYIIAEFSSSPATGIAIQIQVILILVVSAGVLALTKVGRFGRKNLNL